MAYTNGNMFKSVDWWTIAIYVVLVIFGWFSICGASYDYGDMDFFSFTTRAGKQLVWIGCSFVLGFVLLMLDDKLYDMFAYLLYGIMLVILLVTPFIADGNAKLKSDDSKNNSKHSALKNQFLFLFFLLKS